MLTLEDDDDLVAERPVGVESAPTRRPLNLRPLLIGLVVAVLGGGLGTGFYFLSQVEVRDVIGALDVADNSQGPKLALELPWRTAPQPSAETQAAPAEPAPTSPSPAAAPAEPGALLVPPAPPKLGEAPKPAVAEKPEVALPAATAPAAPLAEAPASPAALPAQPSLRGGEAPSFASLPARKAEAKPLPPAPIEGLFRQSAYGPLPVSARDGRQSWQAYARPFDGNAKAPRVAAIVTGLGLEKESTEAAIDKLPPEVTLAFSPYAGGLDKWIKKARDAGHEVMLALPTESAGFPARDPGPWGLVTGMAPDENLSRLEKVLGRATGYVGVLAQDGPFVKSAQLGTILAALKERGLLYLGDGAKPTDPLPPYAAITYAADPDSFRDAVEANLAQAANGVVESGRGVVVVLPRPAMMDRLLAWIETLPGRGVALAPASAVVKNGGK